jgi:hypothetical protein
MMDQLMLCVLREAPNIALSLFCTHEGRPRLLELLQGGREELAVSPSMLPPWQLARSRVQRIHVGPLAWEPADSGPGLAVSRGVTSGGFGTPTNFACWLPPPAFLSASCIPACLNFGP